MTGLMNKPAYTSPEQAEQAFYAAFESNDLDAMMATWEDSDDIVCIHPLWARLRGVAQVRQSWRQLFQSGTSLVFWISGVHSMTEEKLAVRIVYENITVLGANQQPAQPVIATNIYRLGANGWRMIVHHGSPGAASENQPKPPSAQLH